MGESERDSGADRATSQAVVVMGVSGSGKSTIGVELARRLDWEMAEGDSFHPAANVEKMRRGVPLNDADRAPWLERIGEQLKAWAAEGRSGVVTCSALTRAYRQRLLAARPDLHFVYLKASEAVIAERVRARHHQYMPASLLHSQFETLEEPAPGEPVVTVDATAPPGQEVQKIIEALGLSAA